MSSAVFAQILTSADAGCLPNVTHVRKTHLKPAELIPLLHYTTFKVSSEPYYYEPYYISSEPYYYYSRHELAVHALREFCVFFAHVELSNDFATDLIAYQTLLEHAAPNGSQCSSFLVPENRY